MDTINHLVSALTDFTPVSVLFRLLLATLAGGLIGWERGRHGHIAGLRTHILVCIGSATAIMVGLYCSYNLGNNGDMTRIGAQVVSGIGFLGVGTIMVRDRDLSQVTGVTTAAGLWATGAIGLAAGVGFYWGVVGCTAIAIITMTLLANAEKPKKESLAYTRLYAELRVPSDAVFVEAALRSTGCNFDNFTVCPPHSGTPGHLGLEIAILFRDRDIFLDKLYAIDSIVFAVTSE